MVITTIDQHRNISGNAVQQHLDFVFGDHIAGRVIWITNVYKPDVAIVHLRRANYPGNVHSIIFQQWDLDGIGFDVGDKAIDGVVAGVDTHDSLVLLSEGLTDYFEYFTRARAEYHIFFFKP